MPPAWAICEAQAALRAAEQAEKSINAHAAQQRQSFKSASNLPPSLTMPPSGKSAGKQQQAVEQVASVAAVLEDEDLIKIILETGGLRLLCSRDGSLSAPLVCKAWSLVGTGLSRQWCVLTWNHRGSEGKLLETGSPFRLMEIRPASPIVSVPSLCKASAAGALMYSTDSGWVDLVKVTRSLTQAKQHELFHGAVQKSKSLNGQGQIHGIVAVASHLYVALDTNEIGSLGVANKRLTCRFGKAGDGDGAFNLLPRESGLAHCATREHLFVSDTLNNRVAILSTSAAELTWLGSTRGEDSRGKPKLSFPKSLAVVGDDLFAICGSTRNAADQLNVVSLRADDSFGMHLRSIGGQGSALGLISNGLVTAHSGRLFLANNASDRPCVHVLSAEGVLWQAVSLSVRGMLACPNSITVDDKHVYVLFLEGVYILNVREPASDASSSSSH